MEFQRQYPLYFKLHPVLLRFDNFTTHFQQYQKNYALSNLCTKNHQQKSTKNQNFTARDSTFEWEQEIFSSPNRRHLTSK